MDLGRHAPGEDGVRRTAYLDFRCLPTWGPAPGRVSRLGRGGGTERFSPHADNGVEVGRQFAVECCRDGVTSSGADVDAPLIAKSHDMTRSMNGPRWAFQGQGELPPGVGDHVDSAAVDALGGAASFARRGSVGDPRGTRSPERQCRPRPANVLPRGRCVCPCQSELLVSVAAHSAATARRAQRARFSRRPAGHRGVLSFRPPVPPRAVFRRSCQHRRRVAAR